VKELKNKIICGDTLKVLKEMSDNTFDTIITSPPYWGLRDYGVDGQIGLEKTLDEFIEKLLAITQELQRVLKPTGVMFWNHGDNYGGTAAKGEWRDPKNPKGRNQTQGLTAKFMPKCLCLQNYRLILKMIDQQGWILRNTIIWHKPNAMPSSAKDRFSNGYEPVYMLVKKKRYWFDLDAVRVPNSEVSKKRAEYENRRIKEGRGASSIGYKSDKYGMPARFVKLNSSGKNPGDVWDIPTKGFPQAHFAVFPEKLIIPMIKSSCPEEGLVLDPFMGSGTVGKVAKMLGRNYCGIELNKDYIEIANQRIRGQTRAMF